MKTHTDHTVNTSSLQEWSRFLTELNAKKNSEGPLLKKGDSARRIVLHLMRDLDKVA